MKETINSSFCDTAEEANNNLRETILLYLEGIGDLKIREQIFKEKPIVTYISKPKFVTEQYKFEKKFSNHFLSKKSRYN